MKKIFSIILVLNLLFVFMLSANAASSITTDVNLPGFEFSVELAADDTVVHGVSSYSLENSSLTIPDTCNGNIVKYICEKAFYGNKTLNTVILNDNITQIRQRAFRNCSELSYIYCPESLAVIWDYSFAYCKNLKSIFLEHTKVENIYSGAFMGAESLSYISLPPTTKSIGYGCFSGTAIEYINIPDGTVSIGNNAFENNINLKEVYIPSSVTTFGTNVFLGSENVKLYCEKDSAAYQYAVENNVNYELIEKSQFPKTLLGDVNNSGIVDINDVSSMQKRLADYETPFIPDNCDVDKDCRFSLRDATCLQTILVNG